MLVLVLAATGLGVFLYKALALAVPILPGDKTSHWVAEIRATFRGLGDPIKLSIHMPRNVGHFMLIDQQFVAPGYGLSTRSIQGNRQATFSIRQATGEQNIYYRAVIHRGPEVGAPVSEDPPRLFETRFESRDQVAAQAVVEQAKRESADPETFVIALLRALGPASGMNAEALLGSNPTPRKRSRLAAQLLALAGVAARPVHGVRLPVQKAEAGLVHWLEAHLGTAWQPFSLETAEPQIPEDYMRWWHGDNPLVRLEGGEALRHSLAVERITESAVQTVVSTGLKRKSSLFAVSLFGLPLETQQVYRVLMPVTLAVLVIVFFRNVVGVQTFGTFMPILIALAFRETELLWGLFLFSVIVTFGLAARFYLETLKLLVIPRLGSVLILVILLMAAFSIVTHRLGIERGLSVALFPMVILTMMIERMSVVWDERGAREALTQAFASLLVAVFCYLIMTLAVVDHLLFVFPELALVLLSVTMLLGRYSGYRLLELRRFAVLAGRRP